LGVGVVDYILLWDAGRLTVRDDKGMESDRYLQQLYNYTLSSCQNAIAFAKRCRRLVCAERIHSKTAQQVTFIRA